MRELSTLNSVLADSADAISKRNAKSGGITFVPKYIRKGYGKTLSHMAMLLIYALHELVWSGAIFAATDFLAGNLNTDASIILQALQELQRYRLIKVVPGKIRYTNGRFGPDTLCIIITPFDSLDDQGYHKAVDDLIAQIEYVVVASDEKNYKHLGKSVMKPFLERLQGTPSTKVNLIKVGAKYQHPLLLANKTLVRIDANDGTKMKKVIEEDDSEALTSITIEDIITYFYEKFPCMGQDMNRDIEIMRSLYPSYSSSAEYYNVEYLDIVLYTIDMALAMPLYDDGPMESIEDLGMYLNFISDILE